MSEWRVLKFTDDAWLEMPDRLEREYTYSLQDEDVQALGERHGPGTFLLLSNDGGNKFVEFAIGARTEFYEADDAEAAPVPAVSRMLEAEPMSAEAVMERDG